mmetsp:Transcript_6883/g.17365  ORF Transcript_6883/g.17365 Transcript_6883/m.17365 type:complete len:136 (-) Transcript_6883:180-587(-)
MLDRLIKNAGSVAKREKTTRRQVVRVALIFLLFVLDSTPASATSSSSSSTSTSLPASTSAGASLSLSTVRAQGHLPAFRRHLKKRLYRMYEEEVRFGDDGEQASDEQARERLDELLEEELSHFRHIASRVRFDVE